MRLSSCLGVLVLACCCFVGFEASAQIMFEDDFESYDPGPCNDQGGWHAWDLDPNPAIDGEFIDTFGYDGTSKSLQVNASTDVVNVHSGFTGGQWEYTAFLYIPGGTTGQHYFILLNTYSDGGPKNWSVQLNFDSDQGAVFSDGGSQGAGDLGEAPFFQDVWYRIRVEIDLEGNTNNVFMAPEFDLNNEVAIYDNPDPTWYTGPFGGGSGQPAIECVDLFSASQSGPVQYDNITCELLPCATCCPVIGATCEQGAAPDEIIVSWTNPGADWISVDLFRDGMPLQSGLPGTSGSYTDSGVPNGSHTYTIAPSCGTAVVPGECTATVCLAPPDADILVWTPLAADAGAVDDATATFDAIAGAGRTPFRCADLSLALPSDQFDAVFAILGTYPSNHVMSIDEGQALKDYVEQGNGHRGLYVTGGDHKGFDAQTVLDDIDGAEGTADGDPMCDVATVDGIAGTIPDGLDLDGVSFLYNQDDCAWIDHMIPDIIPGSEAVMIPNNGAALDDFCMTYHSGNESGLGDYDVIITSTEYASFLGTQQDLDDLMNLYLGVLAPIVVPPGQPFIRGDVDGMGGVNALVDTLFLLAFGFQGGPAPPCMEAANVDGTGGVNALVDSLFLLAFGFQGGPAPPAPFPACAVSVGADCGGQGAPPTCP